ncbi:MAG: hypothetical protein CMP06_11935 [Xanthomonadales bacterium]|jgi:hypothetical protein|nr:hypothetical protein [Xanthomonadales bacterium]
MPLCTVVAIQTAGEPKGWYQPLIGGLQQCSVRYFFARDSPHRPTCCLDMELIEYDSRDGSFRAD